MEALSGKQRVSAAFKKTFTDAQPELDRVPAYVFTGQVNAQLVGASIRDFLTKPEVFTKAQVAAFERYRPDIMIMMWDLSIECEAIGNELRFPEDSMSITTSEILADKGKLSSLEVPDPAKDGRLPVYIEATAATKKALSGALVSGIIAGPWTIAAGLRGAERLIFDTVDDPDFIHELMELCCQTSIRFAEAISAIGVGLGYSEAPCSCSLISPKIYREFVFPYHKRIVDHLKKQKIGVGLHVCGYSDPILEDVVATGVSNVSIDALTDFSAGVKACRGKAVLIGNVATDLFISGTKEDMAQAIKSCIDNAPEDSGFVLAPGCEVPGIATPERIEWFMELAEEFSTPTS
jgi:uroporphyrinogen decarboxylase